MAETGIVKATGIYNGHSIRNNMNVELKVRFNETELANAIAKNLHSSKMIDRMIVYLNCVKPKSADEIVDEMLALMSDRDRWIKKKEAEYCNGKNNEWMNRKNEL